MDVTITATITATIPTPANNSIEAMREATGLFTETVHKAFSSVSNIEFMDIDFPDAEASSASN